LGKRVRLEISVIGGEGGMVVTRSYSDMVHGKLKLYHFLALLTKVLS
jgi:hypothetical protein